MANSRRTRAPARTPTPWWASALLKGGGTMLDSMNAAARNARVTVLPEPLAPAHPRPAKVKRPR